MRTQPTAAAIDRRESTKRACLLSVAQLAPKRCFVQSEAFAIVRIWLLRKRLMRPVSFAGLSASFERWAAEGGASTKETVIEYDKIFAVSTQPTPRMSCAHSLRSNQLVPLSTKLDLESSPSIWCLALLSSLAPLAVLESVLLPGS
eukprot:COSAG04_NODE_1047_length_8562_cov_9.403167_3_plen_146_part_00